MTQTPLVMYPELVEKIISVAGNTFEYDAYIQFIRNASLVSPLWYHETRRPVFRSVTVSVEWDTKHGRTVLDLVDVLDKNPRIGQLIEEIEFCPKGPQAERALKRDENAFSLLPDRLSMIRGLTLDWFEWFYGEGERDLGPPPLALPPIVHAAIRQLCLLPTLQDLYVIDAPVSSSTWIDSPNLRNLDISGPAIFDLGINHPVPHDTSERRIRSRPHTPPLESIHFTLQKAPPIADILAFYPSLFQHLTDLSLSGRVGRMKEVQLALDNTRSTLVEFRCGVFWFETFHDIVPNVDQHGLDLKEMTKLRSVSITHHRSPASGFASMYPVVLNTLQSIPWTQIETVLLRVHVNCPRPPHPHVTFDPKIYFRDFDSLVAPHVARGGHSTSNGPESGHRLGDITLNMIHRCSRCSKDTGYEIPDARALLPHLYSRVDESTAKGEYHRKVTVESYFGPEMGY